jgi:hypothetical protein
MNNLFVLFLALLSLPALSAEAPKADTIEGTSILRVGGDYSVAKIDKVGERSFVVEFKSENPTGRFDLLRLESDHVHVAVKVGQKIRLSAEILSEKDSTAEVAQVVVFLPAQDSHVPVWLLSNKATNHELRATKFLEMHDPQTDFTVL